MASLDLLLRKRSAIKAKLTNFTNYMNVLLSCKTISDIQRLELESRFKKFEATYDEFNILQVDIEVLSDDPGEAYAERAKFEDRYHALVAQAHGLLANNESGDGGSVTGSVNKYSGESFQQRNFIRLPKIDLPNFNGSYQYWLEYRDTYLSLIHNSSCIDAISKFHYLRASLEGDALEIIKNIDFKGDNYQMAWKLLCDRFDNSRLLVDTHLKALHSVDCITQESSTSLRRLNDLINKNLRALNTMDEPTDSWDTLIIYNMAMKLDPITSREWEAHRNTIPTKPKVSQFCSFISKKADLLETIEHNRATPNIESSTNTHGSQVGSKHKSLVVAANQADNNSKQRYEAKCPLCKQNHLLFTCEGFRKLNVEQRILKVKEFKVCFNCLRSGHVTKRCRLARCKYCKGRHNTLLHVEQSTHVQDPMPNSVALPTGVSGGAPPHNGTSENISLSSDARSQYTTSHILLSTALVRVVNHRGIKSDARILLDNGSTANFITQKLCDQLGLPRRGTSSTVTGINSHTTLSTQSCNLTIESCSGSYRTDINCFILPTITKLLPSTLVDISSIPIPLDLNLADPSFNVPSEIDILVGAEIFWNILGSASINLGKNQPKLHETKLGWIVSGSVALPKHPSKNIYSHFCNISMNDLNNSLTKFWELDSVSSEHSLSQEERACEESFRINTVRDQNGHFIVTMPLKNDPSELGESYEMAKRRFLSLERRFQRDPAFKERYVAFIEEYVSLGHMTVNNSTRKPHSGNKSEYFLPHHGVIRESSTTTKLRVVFDASAATTSGVSFNDIQMVGPTVQDDLFSILLRFRQHRFVISGDIEKMYRAIQVTPSQRQLQQIIFRADPKLPLQTYSLNTVTYGTASAPYLATKSLVSLAATASNDVVKSSIERDFYVDDYLGGGDSVSMVVQMGKEVASILASANFHLRKWQSNSLDILTEIAGVPGHSDRLNLSEDRNVSSKTLGLYWLCKSDSLEFSISVDTSKPITKRHILSVISQIFDPLGLVGPCIIEAKIIIQSLWTAKCDWDEQVPDTIHTSWLMFVNSLPCLNTLKIPRWISCDNSTINEIHVFTDASEKAYGACIYIKSTTKDGLVRVQLLVSKTRVAPIKPTTIPRLELCGALLGARLCVNVRNSFTKPISKCYFWCDSTIVLRWLSMTPNLLKPFVRNRINEIQECTMGHTWSYVPSKENPADLVSRGLKADLISECSLWWSGPQFLLKAKIYWPKMPNETLKQDLPEVVSSHFTDHSSHHQSYNNLAANHLSHNNNNNSFIKSLIHKYSNYNHLLRVVAYILRFIYNLKHKHNRFRDSLACEELKNSTNFILRHAQIDMFPDEYHLLQSGKSLPKKNRLISLSPFTDSNGLIRVGGRLDNSPYDYNVKHPVLLCGKHHITKVIFNKYHLDCLHAGPQLLLANIRQMYWPLGGRNLSKSIVKNCIKCFKHKCQTVQPTMGQLPSSRTHLKHPFLNSSVDYAGPVLIADRKGRGCRLIKAYLCIFVCLAVKAVHIELVTDLTKEAYKAALNRFVARRGKPESILSDNGTNFIGTCNELRKFLQDSNLVSEVAQQGIKFSFAPPYSPHFNGIAEAAVKSTKHHLKRLLGLTHFTYEEMATCLTQIEAVLNSRPLTPLSTDPLDFSVLTPGHFIIGRPLISIPHPQVTDHNIGRLERYQRVEQIKQHFWNRFHLEYVSLLQQKTKWTASTGQLSVGALVLIKEKGQPPLVWPLGRVTKVFPGCDGTTRVVELKTKRGTVVRAYNNVCPLPLT